MRRPPSGSPFSRLAIQPSRSNAGEGTLERPGALAAPSVRLACVGGAQGEVNGALAAPSVRLAAAGANQRNANFDLKPGLLASFVYLRSFQEKRTQGLYDMRDWVLDSGAFSAHSSGKPIKLQEYIDTCKHLLATDSLLAEVFALDVIGDWRASIRNCEAMWRQGIPAIPAFHRGSPESELKAIARDYPKVALGGVARLKGAEKLRWASQCFARVWPKRIHGFGFATEEAVLSLPFHSVDATSWELGPCGFGNWKAYGKMRVLGSGQDLRPEVERYLRLEQRARVKWKKAMEELK